MLKLFKILMVLFVLISCKENRVSESAFEKYLIKPVDFGEYHALQDDGIKIFLPEGFRKLSASEIYKSHDSIKNEKIREYVKRNYRIRKFMPGNYYDFFNEEYSGEVIVNTLEYLPFDRSTAGQLLYLLRKDHERDEKITGIGYEKVTSKYMENSSTSIFKAIYRLQYPDSTKVKYQHDLDEIYNFATLYTELATETRIRSKFEQ